MEINKCLGAVNAYNQAKLSRTKTESAPAATTSRNTDKVEFSSVSKSEEGLRASIAQKVEQSASSDRIAELTYSINSGNYNVASELIAKSILA